MPEHCGRLIELQPFGRADFGRLIGWITDARLLVQWAGPTYTFPLDAAQLEANQLEAESCPPRRHHFRAIERASGDMVGYIELVRHRQAPHWGRLARVLIGPPAARGRGLGADMVRQAATFGFGALGLEGIDLAVYTFNHQAIACYRRVGFAVAEPLPPTRFAGESWPGQRMHLPRAAWLRLTLAGGGTAP